MSITQGYVHKKQYFAHKRAPLDGVWTKSPSPKAVREWFSANPNLDKRAWYASMRFRGYHMPSLESIGLESESKSHTPRGESLMTQVLRGDFIPRVGVKGEAPQE